MRNCIVDGIDRRIEGVIMNREKFLICLLILLFVGCKTVYEKEEKSIEIVVSHKERETLEPGSKAVAILEDVSKRDIASGVLSIVSIPIENLTFNLEINYFEDDIEEGKDYNIRVIIVNDERLLYTSKEMYNPFNKRGDGVIELKKVS